MPHRLRRSSLAASARLARFAGSLALGTGLALAPLAAGPVGNTTISTNTTTGVTTTISGNNVVTVNTGVTLTFTGNSTSSVNQAITVTGNGILNNNGTINATATSTPRGIRDNTGGLTLTINNFAGATITAAEGDAIQMNKANSNFTLNNSGNITVSPNSTQGGSQAVDLNAITTGSNTINNFAGGFITAVEADAVRPGVNGVVSNAGTIKSVTSTGSSSDGVDGQNNTGISVTNNSGGLIEGGRHGITGGNTTTGVYTMSITNNSGATIQGDNGSGVNIDGLNNQELVTIVNHGTITGNGVTGDGDGVDVDGLVNLTNSGTIKSFNSFIASGTETSEGVTVGGGTITNSGTIEGDVAAGNGSAVGRGITLAGVDKDSTGASIPIQGIYANTTVTNSGLIRGMTDSGIAVFGPATGFTVTINNLAGGVIEGSGATAATIQTGDDNDVITNAGSIINDGGDSKTAISLGGGDDHLTVTGNSAVITGGIDGGTGNNRLTFDLGAANYSFTHSGVISNFSTVEVLSGRITLNGANTYTGVTNVVGGTLFVNGSLGNTTTTVSSGAILGGSGTIGGATTIKNGGHLAPGNSAGTITFTNGLALENGAVFDFQLGSTSDKIFVTGGTLTEAGAIMLNLSDAGGFAAGRYTLLDFTGANLGTFNASDFMIGNAIYGFTYQFSLNGNTLELNATAVPEPTTCAAILGVGALGVAAWCRRRKA